MHFENSKKNLALGLIALLLLGLGGCAGNTVDDSDPGALYQEAEANIKSEHYQLAVDELKTIKNKFPYSRYAVDAQLRLADVYMMQESYTDAAAQYELFRDLHPKHEKVPYSVYQTAKAYFSDIPSPIARDMTPAQKCAETLEEYLKKYPKAPEKAEAVKMLATVRGLLAEKELYIANFYLKTGVYISADGRYHKILEKYADTPAAETAKVKLAETETHKPYPTPTP